MNKKFVSVLFALCIMSILSLSAFAKSVDGGEWTVGYHGNNIYSRYQHETKPHGASTQVWDDDDWCTDRVCKSSGVVACSEQEDNYRHTGKHGHGYYHRCGIDISD